MQAIGISPNLLRVLASTAPDLLAELFAPGKVLDAEVISVFQDRAMLSFGRGIRLEVALQAALREGQRVKLQVQPRDPGGSLVLKLVQPAPPQQSERGGAPPVRPGTPAVPAQPHAPATPAPQPPTGPSQAQRPGAPAPAAMAPPAQPPTAAKLAPPALAAPARMPTPTMPAAQTPATPPAQPQAPVIPAAETPAPPAQPPTQATPAAQAPATPSASPQAPVIPAAQAPATPAQTQTRAPQGDSPAPADPAGQRPVGEQPPAITGGPQGSEPQTQASRESPAKLPAPHTQETQAPAPQAPDPRVRSLEPQAQAPQTQGPPARTEAGAAAGGPAASGPDGPPGLQSPAPAPPQPPVTLQRTEPGQPPLIWIPVPLENGKQGWAQLQIQEGDPRTARTGAAQHQIRLWWETPALGQVQVTMDATAHSLTTLITVLMAQVRARVEEGLPGLQSRLAAAGFTEVQVGCRQAMPGEPIGPVVPADSAARLDRRL